MMLMSSYDQSEQMRWTAQLSNTPTAEDTAHRRAALRAESWFASGTLGSHKRCRHGSMTRDVSQKQHGRTARCLSRGPHGHRRGPALFLEMEKQIRRQGALLVERCRERSVVVEDGVEFVWLEEMS